MSNPEPHYAGVPRESVGDVPRRPVHVVLDNIRSAYNVGSMFRTADAAAVTHLHLCGMCAHPPHAKLEKTALGAQDYVPWTYHERAADAVDDLKARGIPCVAIEVTPEAVPMDSFAWPSPVAVVFGNEVNGVQERVLRRCDSVVRIPMHGHKNSLNVATAFGIVLYDLAARQD